MSCFFSSFSYFTAWEPSDYGGIDVIPIRGDNIYLPVIVRQSSAAEMTPIFSREGGLSTLIWVDYMGNVYATVAGTFRTDCRIDLVAFPFDNQTCDFVFQVWQHSNTQLALQLDPLEPISLQVKSSASQAMWMIDELIASERVATLDIANFSALVYTVKTSRRSVYYIWNLLIPCALLSTVQLAAFFMPYGPERVMFAITLVLSLHLFQESVNRQLPATAEPIPIMKYSGSQMMIGIMVTIESVIMIYALQVLGGRRVPKWLSQFRNIFYTRGRRAFLLRLRKDNAEAEAKEKEVLEKSNDGHDSKLSLGNGVHSNIGSRTITSRKSSMTVQGHEKMTVEEKEERVDEWKDTILMFDRMVFVLCLAATVIIPASVYEVGRINLLDNTL